MGGEQNTCALCHIVNDKTFVIFGFTHNVGKPSWFIEYPQKPHKFSPLKFCHEHHVAVPVVAKYS